MQNMAQVMQHKAQHHAAQQICSMQNDAYNLNGNPA